MFILIREGRKKFGYPSKPNCCAIIDEKNKFLVKIVQKCVKNLRKLDIFGVKMKNSTHIQSIQVTPMPPAQEHFMTFESKL